MWPADRFLPVSRVPLAPRSGLERTLRWRFRTNRPASARRSSASPIATLRSRDGSRCGASAPAPRSCERRVDFENHEIIDPPLRGTKQSVVLLAPHFCNWEWLLARRRRHVPAPDRRRCTRSLRVKSLDQYLRDARARFGGKPFPRQDFVYELMRPRRHAARLRADRRPDAAARGPAKHWTRMLDRDTAFFLGAERIAPVPRRPGALCRDAPACAAATIRCVSLARGAAARDRLERGDHSPVMEGFARQLERAVRASPADWLWLQKRWKYPKPAAT